MGSSSLEGKWSRRVLRSLIAALFAITTTALGGVRPADAADVTRVEPDLPSDSQALPWFAKSSSRVFSSARLDLGLGYLKTNFAIGFGKPHWAWIGLDTIQTVSPWYGRVEAGVRARWAVFESYVHVVSTRSFALRTIPNSLAVDAEALTASDSPQSSYRSIEASIWGTLPLLHGAVYAEVSYARVLDGLAGSRVMLEEFQRLIIGTDGYLLGRIGYQYAFSPKFYAGVFADVSTAFGRDQTTTVRVGPGAWIKLGDHSDIVLLLLEPIVSPDRLGLWTGMTAAASLRVFIATGDSLRFP